MTKSKGIILNRKKGIPAWNKGIPPSKETREKISKTTKGRIGKPQTEETKKKLRELNLGALNPNFGKPKSEETKRKMRDAQIGKKKKKLSKDTCRKMSLSKTGLKRDDKTREKLSIGQYEYNCGGFWYGAVKYHTKKVYCELWNRDLWDRIDAFWDNKSVLSGKTKEDNNNRALSRHHVYWQPKACCEWDEDKQGYYSILNIGTAKQPNLYKHYIKGSPNKFVLLTQGEHASIKKDKLKWIKIFEDIIESRKGKSYFTKEDMKTFKY